MFLILNTFMPFFLNEFYHRNIILPINAPAFYCLTIRVEYKQEMQNPQQVLAVGNEKMK